VSLNPLLNKQNENENQAVVVVQVIEAKVVRGWSENKVMTLLKILKRNLKFEKSLKKNPNHFKLKMFRRVNRNKLKKVGQSKFKKVNLNKLMKVNQSKFKKMNLNKLKKVSK